MVSYNRDDVRESQGECLPNWPSARLTANALRFSNTNRPAKMEDLPFSPHLLCDWNVQEGLEALPDPNVVHLRESERQLRTDNPEHVICPGSGAQQEQEPSTLEIGDMGDSVQKNSMFVNLFIKLALHEVHVPQWSAENGDALLVRGKTVVSAPNATWLTICIKEGARGTYTSSKKARSLSLGRNVS